MAWKRRPPRVRRMEHGAWVPVIAVNGKVRFRARVNAVLLARLFRGEADRTRRGA